MKKNKERLQKTTTESSQVHMDAMLNPFISELVVIANEYQKKIEDALPKNIKTELGGSLVSNTALLGHNDIDIRVLAPNCFDTEKDIRSLSDTLNPIIPFQKIKPVGSHPNQQFGVMHELKIEHPKVGELDIEVSIRPEYDYIGFAKYQTSLPSILLEQYLRLKYESQTSKEKYKKVKQQFYALTRWLYNRDYWSTDIIDFEKDILLKQAITLFWSDTLLGVLEKANMDTIQYE